MKRTDLTFAKKFDQYWEDIVMVAKTDENLGDSAKSKESLIHPSRIYYLYDFFNDNNTTKNFVDAISSFHMQPDKTSLMNSSIQEHLTDSSESFGSSSFSMINHCISRNSCELEKSVSYNDFTILPCGHRICNQCTSMISTNDSSCALECIFCKDLINSVSDDILSLMFCRIVIKILNEVRSIRDIRCKAQSNEKDNTQQEVNQEQNKLNQLLYCLIKFKEQDLEKSNNYSVSVNNDPKELISLFFTHLFNIIPLNVRMKLSYRIETSYKCTECGHVHTRKEPWNCHFSLPIDPEFVAMYHNDDTCKKRSDFKDGFCLQELYRIYFKKEHELVDYDCDQCAKKYKTIMKYKLVTEAPMIFMISLSRNRFIQEGGYHTDNRDPIFIPKKFWLKSSEYIVRSLIIHEMESNEYSFTSHYYCYCFVNLSGSWHWIKCDDESVTLCDDPLNEDKVKSCCSMVIYQSVESLSSENLNTTNKSTDEGSKKIKLPFFPNWKDLCCSFNTMVQALAFIDFIHFDNLYKRFKCDSVFQKPRN